MKLVKNSTIAALCLVGAVSCRQNNSQDSSEARQYAMEARVATLKAKKEWVVYYANETNLTGTIRYGSQVIGSQGALYRSYLKALRLETSEVASKWEDDLRLFPSSVTKEVTDLERTICGGKSASTAGLIVFTNDDLNRQQYRVCESGKQQLIAKQFDSLTSSNISIGGDLTATGAPAASYLNFRAAMDIVKKIVRESEKDSSHAGVALILKSHGWNGKPVISCHVAPDSSRRSDTSSVAQVGENKSLSLGTEGNPSLSAEGQFPMYSGEQLIKLNSDGSNRDLAKPAEVSAFLRASGKLGLDCHTDGFDMDVAQGVISDLTEPSRVQIELTIVFFDSCKSALGKSGTKWGSDVFNIPDGGAEVWGFAKDTGYLTVDYSGIDKAPVGTGDQCGNLDFYCSLKQQLVVLSKR